MNESPRNQPSVESLGEKDTIAFLEANGIKRLETWKPGTAVLCVLGEGARAATKDNYSFTADRFPSLVRCENPTNVEFNITDIGLSRIVYGRDRDSKRVDYYCIDGKTKTPVLVRTAKTIAEGKQSYFVRKSDIFAAADHLFPPSSR